MRLLAALMILTTSAVMAADLSPLEEAQEIAFGKPKQKLSQDFLATQQAIYEAGILAASDQDNAIDYFAFEDSAHLDSDDPLADVPYNAADLNDLLAVDPVPGARISSHYGKRGSRFHEGLDLAAATGSPIYATGAGVVVFAGAMSGYGRMIEIDHGNGYTTRYGHPSAMYVQKGDYVKAKQKIAAVGCAGRCSGPHLHYEVRRAGRAINPAPFIALARE